MHYSKMLHRMIPMLLQTLIENILMKHQPLRRLHVGIRWQLRHASFPSLLLFFRPRYRDTEAAPMLLSSCSFISKILSLVLLLRPIRRWWKIFLPMFINNFLRPTSPKFYPYRHPSYLSTPKGKSTTRCTRGLLLEADMGRISGCCFQNARDSFWP